mmetsp:Transcript_21242/g.56766  ORF Transcript_21242/g.56766 Transcript_21242/m.56766 type:complete len:368 (+) Transcript_21242:166-1269(+)
MGRFARVAQLLQPGKTPRPHLNEVVRDAHLGAMALRDPSFLKSLETTHRKQGLHLHQLSDFTHDAFGIVSLPVCMLPLAATARSVRAASRVPEPRISALQHPGSEAHAQSRVRVQRFRHQDELQPTGAEHRQRVLVHGIEVPLVDQPDRDALRLQPLHGIQGPVERVPVAHDVAVGALPDRVVRAEHRLIVLAVERALILPQDLRCLRARAVDETQAAVPENLRHDLPHLRRVGRPEELRPRSALVREPAVGEEVVLPEVAHVVAHVVDAAVREVKQHVAPIQPRHRDLRNDHLLERRKRAEDPLTLGAGRVEAEACARGEVSALHHPGLLVHLGTGLANDLQPTAALEIAVDDDHTALALVLRKLL